MKRLALLHTAPFLVDMFKGLLAERYPELDSFHMVDESLIQEARTHGGMTPSIVYRIMVHCHQAQSAGAEAILFSCSSTSQAVNKAREVIDVPILKIDDAMAERAVRSGPRIGLVCTSKTTVGPSEAILNEYAEAQGATIAITRVVDNDAYFALRNGDKAGHDTAVSKAARGLDGSVDVIVLAQASLAHLAEGLDAELSVPVLASPRLCVESLASVL